MTFQRQLSDLLETWKAAHPEKTFPSFDSRVKDFPHTLVFMESPGPVTHDTGVVSIHNEDPTAREMKRLLELGFGEDNTAEVLCWNAIPWHATNISAAALRDAKPIHADLLRLLAPRLEFVVLMGVNARKLLPFLSVRVGGARILGGHHTSAQAQLAQHTTRENEGLFRFLRSETGNAQRRNEG